MNPSDSDLDCLLKAWTVPHSPDSLERRVRRAYGDRAYSRTTPGLLEGSASRWIAGLMPMAGKFAGVIASAVVLLAVITRAFPQSLGLVSPPAAIIIDSEFLDYKDDGSSTAGEYRTSSVSSLDGETIWSSSFPGDPLRTVAGVVVNPVKSVLNPMMHRVIDPLFYKSGRTEHMRALAEAEAARIRNGCTPTNHWGTPMEVIGEETVLNYTTTVSRFSEGRDVRITEWFAPELDCLSLKSTTEKALPDGTFRLAGERRVLKVKTKPSKTAAKNPNR